VSANARLAERSLRAVWHPCTQMKHHEALPIVPISRAEGVWLYDFEGHRILDAISSWWVNLLGHGHPRVNAALRAQLDSLEHVMLAGLTHEPAVELAERLARLAPRGLGHCSFGSDGASAVEIALKMSHQYWRNVGKPEKAEFVALANGYHGETLGALSVTDIPLFRDSYAPLLHASARVSSPDGRLARPGETPAECAARCALALEAHLERHAGQTAAFIVEPLVQCAGGMAMHDPEYLRRAREICDRFEVLLIADEIAVGFGRTGTLFACEQASIVPDLLCLSKGITGGYLPLSVVMAALAVLDVIEDEHILKRNRDTAAYLNRRAEAIRSHPRVGHFRNTGMIWAFDVQDAGQGFARDFSRRALEAGVLLRPLGSTVYWMPPYAIEAAEIDFLIEAVSRLLDAQPG